MGANREREGTLLRIWINRSYSTTANAIVALHREPPAGGVHVLGTHVDPTSPVLAVCDVTEAEPDVEDDAYLSWALDLCRRHRIDVIVPRAHAHTLASARDAFAAIGAAVLAAAPGTIALLGDKARAYAAAAEVGLLVPPHRVVRSGSELLEAVRQIADVDGTVCMKPVSAAGASGFRIIDTAPPTLAQLLADPEPTVHPKHAAAALDEDGAPPFLVMPVLPGPEVSVDCLADADGALRSTVTRTKHHRGVRLDEDEEARAAATALVAHHRIAFLSNTQFRYWRQPGVDLEPRPYLLETNPRASAGLYQSVFTGLHLFRDAIDLAAGRRPEAPGPRTSGGLVVLPSAYPLPD